MSSAVRSTLRRQESAEDNEDMARGKLRIHLGAAPGVG
jgi:K+-sensing histidine kinase KdpD